jgi:deazaflavin-dependent oxidoreductase (nitroreductase family)
LVKSELCYTIESMDNEKVIEDFRANGGKVGGWFAGMELLLLHVTGAKSGKEYVKPLVYTRDGDNYVVIASKGGAHEHPAWYYNLVAHPETTVEVGTETFNVKAREATGDERTSLYDAQAEKYPNFKEYQEKTDRVIPVFVLEKV